MRVIYRLLIPGVEGRLIDWLGALSLLLCVWCTLACLGVVVLLGRNCTIRIMCDL